MITDGLSAIDSEMEVKDIAEIVWEQLKANDAAIEAKKSDKSKQQKTVDMRLLVVSLLAEEAFGKEGVKEIIARFDNPEVFLWSTYNR